jgi:hypothetical protein
MLEGNDRSKVQRTVSDIVAGNFDDRFIDVLFFNLRNYSKKDSLFREIAHFIAHPEREIGKFRDFILAYSKKVKFIWDFKVNKKYDIHAIFPMYALDLLCQEIKLISNEILQKKYNMTQQQLIKLVKRNIVKYEN